MIIVEQTTDSVAAQVLGPEGRGFFSVELTGATLMAAAVATPAALAADPRVELWPQVRSARRFLTTSTAFSPECGKQDKRASRRSRSRALGARSGGAQVFRGRSSRPSGFSERVSRL